VNETQLIRDLLKDYESDARPVKDQSDAVKVELQMIYKELKEIVRRRHNSIFFCDPKFFSLVL
jgi:hypothetical protein